MKKLFRSRTFLGIGSILLAVLVCLVIAPTLSVSRSRQVEVVRVIKKIPESAQVTKDMVQTVKVGGYNLPSNTVTDPNKVIGRYATATLQPGDNILDSKIAEQAPSAYLSQLNGKQVAVSISIKNFASGVSGKLESGDIICLDVANYGDLKQTLAPEELRYVQLLAATNDNGSDNDAENVKDAKQEDMPSTLTVLVTPAQMQKLVDYENNGTLHAALVYRGTQENAQKFLDKQMRYLNQQTQNGGSEVVK
ncbi:RcpC/CpaB family pilus assembly protein [Clostridium sp. KNHs216]|uniref:Flp pilus assembly protein CpaB n=1 Tax=Clostridium sp. KNHs216 TaxID=1550235 RepID=UPI001151D82E|nr:RcpC/CpaB family pilus assembly protein [Clostridium sp. KNHs216]TQI68557.1 pilus assembly protein CpaB [Clostridium sp. KNHs216]